MFYSSLAAGKKKKKKIKDYKKNKGRKEKGCVYFFSSMCMVLVLSVLLLPLPVRDGARLCERLAVLRFHCLILIHHS